jgi:hypothetical protein
MLLDDDVMADRQAKASSFPSRFGGEKGVEYLFPNLWRNPNTIVPNLNLQTSAEASGSSGNGRLEPAPFLRLAPA